MAVKADMLSKNEQGLPKRSQVFSVRFEWNFTFLTLFLKWFQRIIGGYSKSSMILKVLQGFLKNFYRSTKVPKRPHIESK